MCSVLEAQSRDGMGRFETPYELLTGVFGPLADQFYFEKVLGRYRAAKQFLVILKFILIFILMFQYSDFTK